MGVKNTLKYIYDLEETTSTTISTQVRTVSFSVLAFGGSLLIGGPSQFQDATTKGDLIWVCGLAIFTMALDFSQMLTKYIYNVCTRRKYEKEHKNKTIAAESIEIEYEYSSILYWLIWFFFVAKQVSLVVSVYFLLSVIWKKV